MKDATGRAQTAVVFGGGSDIGAAIARRLAGQGVGTIVLAGRKPERFGDLADELRRLGAGRIETVAFDGDAVEAHGEVVETIAAMVGDLDLAVIVFGVLGEQAALERDPEAAAALLHTNMVAPGALLLLLGERMRAQGHGDIVVLSSVAGERARRSNFVYGASKAGVDALAQGLGDRLHGTGVHVLVVRPGFVRTKMTSGLPPAPLAVDADRVAAAAVDGLRRRAEIVWVPPALRVVMFGLRHLPRAVFRRLPI